MKRWMMAAMLLLALASGRSWAVTLVVGQPSTFCDGRWSGSTFVCSGNTTAILGPGENIEADRPITLESKQGFVFTGPNTVGDALNTIQLLSGTGSISITDGTIHGSLVSEGAISLVRTRVYGSVITDNSLDISGGYVGGALSAKNLVIVAGATIDGDVTSVNTAVTIVGSTINGDIDAKTKIDVQNSVINGDCTANVIQGGCGGVVTIDHYQLSYASQALTCQPHAVTLTACADAACSQIHSGQSTLSLSPAGWQEGATFSFVGSTTGHLAIRSAATVTLAVSGTPMPAALNPLQCRIDGGAPTTDCRLAFADAGLRVTVPDLIAGKPATATISAVRKSDDSLACVPAFANVSRPVALWSTYVSPDAASQVGSRQVFIEGTAIGNDAAGPVTLPLTFDAGGQARVALRYDDAGRLQLDARYQGSAASGDEGLSLSGAGSFDSLPYGLHLRSEVDCTAAGGCTRLPVAGDDFALGIRAVAWQQDGEPLTAEALADNPGTPNFRLDGIALSSRLEPPVSGGVDGTLSVAGYDHRLGEETPLALSQSEVGIFRIEARPPAGAYLGRHTVSGGSALAGRFIPANLLAASDAELQPACSGSGFSYQGQIIEFSGAGPQVAVLGRNRQGAVTRNYDRAPFWRLAAAPRRQPYAFSDAALSGLGARLEALGEAQSLAVADSGAADGQRAFAWTDEAASGRQRDALRWRLPESPSAEDAPLLLAATGAHVQLRLAAGELRDQDGVCFRGADGAAAECQDFVHAVAGTELRLGRVRAENVIAAPLGSPPVAPMPLLLEHWNGTAFTAATDSCTQVQYEADPALTFGYSGNLSEATVVQPVALADRLAPVQALQWTGSPLKGAVAVKHLLTVAGSAMPAHWLCREGAPTQGGVCTFGRNADGSIREARADATATFGLFVGRAPLIYRREVYR